MDAQTSLAVINPSSTLLIHPPSIRTVDRMASVIGMWLSYRALTTRLFHCLCISVQIYYDCESGSFYPRCGRYDSARISRRRRDVSAHIGRL